MHEHYEVFIRASSKAEVEPRLEELLRPFCDFYGGIPGQTFFDWFHIAGRKIMPEKITCPLCHGTGRRSDGLVQE